LKLAETYAITNIWTEAAFNVNPIQFVTGMAGRGGAFSPGTDGGDKITLPELLGAGPGGIGGNYGSYATGFTDAVSKNLGGLEGIAMAGLKTAGVSIGFKLVSKLTRRPRSLLNAQIKNLGVGDMVRV
tara:strand:- start:493 stop:876 length:384 start_codon:yes stop_codon:yes gene_type:complete